VDDGIPHSLEEAAAMGKLAACCGTSQQQVMREPASHFLRLLGMCHAMKSSSAMY
jgi:hypothetical protein